MAQVINTTFQFKRGKATTWTTKNLVLQAGEPGFEIDTYRLKIGDGTTAWNNLPYFGGTATIQSDGASIEVIDGRISLKGFYSAGTGYLAMKNSSNELTWVNKISVDLLEVPDDMEFIIEDRI